MVSIVWVTWHLASPFRKEWRQIIVWALISVNNLSCGIYALILFLKRHYHGLTHTGPTFWLAWMALSKELPWTAYEIHNKVHLYKQKILFNIIFIKKKYINKATKKFVGQAICIWFSWDWVQVGALLSSCSTAAHSSITHCLHSLCVLLLQGQPLNSCISASSASFAETRSDFFQKCSP